MTLIALPIIWPLIMGVITALWRNDSAMRSSLSILAGLVQVGLTSYFLVTTYQNDPMILMVGGWSAPFGIALVIDHLAAILITIAAIITLAVLSYMAKHYTHPLQLPLICFMLAGVSLSFITGDFFNLFVAFEIMLMASYALMMMSFKPQDLKHGYTYLMLNIIGSALFLAATGLVYRLTGTLNFTDIGHVMLHSLQSDYRVTLIAVLMIVVYGLKAGMIPLFYWLPNSYSALPAGIAGLFAGLLTKVGLYALLRVLTVLVGTHTLPLNVILVLAVPTILVGIIMAIKQDNIHMILSYNLISHVGFMLVGIGLFSAVSITGTIYYMAHHMIVISSLFLIAGIMSRETGTNDIRHMGNLMTQRPGLSLLFGLQALSLVGMPPFSGFWGKLLLLTASVTQGHNLIAGTLLIATILTLLSMITILFKAIYAKTDCLLTGESCRNHYISVIGLTIVSVGLGLFSAGGLASSDYAAGQIRSLTSYQLEMNQIGRPQ